ncbi:MAG: molybdopterin-dependent oxidoreductase [Bdellovibrionaceae bacterium]|nr:molybdopterin-dependent oxidoreductase [Bdellovibrionales bacterium]MCB9083807.1 molybdopterin-dependent oxidoreductase [Pseudobdellovibrionaceae bacterium]
MSYKIIGKKTPYIDSVDKVTGRAKYADDFRLHHALRVKILRSPYANAKLLSVDVSEAKKYPGVVDFVLGDDFHRTFGVLPISKDEPAMAKERVRYVGEPVAAVIAESERAAIAAMKLIRVEYEVKKPHLDSQKSLLESDDLIHPELGKKANIHKTVKQTFGDVEEGLKSAELVVEGKFDFESVTHAFTEPHATQVEWDGDNLTVISATQVPHYLHRALSDVLEIPMHRLRVIKPQLGGGFGGKSDPFPHEMIAVKAALKTGRNIRLTFEREEVFYSHHGRHPTKIKMKLGVSKDKGIQALDGYMLIDGGAYGSFGVVTTYYNGVLLQGPYTIPNFNFHCDRVYTNKPMCGAMRGHGGVNPRFASEVLLDEACHQLQVDPCEMRLAHFHQPNSKTTNEFRITSVGIHHGLKNAMAASEWKSKYGKLPYGKGIGVGCGFFISGSALPIHWNEMPQSTVRLTIDFDGGVTLYSGASDIGQGSNTMLAQMAAEVLGLPMNWIKVIAADTRTCPIDYGSYSSRVTFMAGNAARNAAIRMRRQLVEAACQLLEMDPPPKTKPGDAESFFRQGGRAPDYDNLYLGANPNYQDGFTFVDEKVVSPDGRELAYMDVVRKGLDFQGALQSKGGYVSPKMGGSFKGAGAGLSPSYSYTAFISEVTVDAETGFVKVDRVTCAHDYGQALNPLAVEGQLQGSIHMGLGQVLMEGMRYENGAVQNSSLLEYKIPSPFEQPEIVIVPGSGDENEGPFGAKEVGEGALAPFNPSVANAIFDAVGVRLHSLPITPEKVLQAIREKEGVKP